MTDVNSSTIRLSWEPPPPESQNGQLMYYHVIITETKVVNLENRTVSFLMGFNITSRYEISQGRVQLITELHPSYRYSFKISAATSAGIGVYSSSMNVTLMEGGEFARLKAISFILIKSYMMHIIIINAVYIISRVHNKDVLLIIC